MRLFWHRRDLRAADNRGLAAAAADDGGGTVVPAFVFDDALLEHASPPRVRYLLDALADLRAWYRERGSDLVVARGEPSAEIPALVEGHDADRAYWNEDYSGVARERDRAVEAALTREMVDVRTFHDAVHHEPGDITTNDGDPYRVYSYFWKKWRDREKRDPVDPPAADALAAVAGDDLPSIEELGFEEPDADVQSGGTEAARERLDAFCAGPIHDYEEARDYPAREATSRLSADLKWGTVGVREVYAATTEAREDRDDGAGESVAAFRSQLAWREFYAQVLWDEPSVVTENYRSYAEPIEWRDAPADLRAWKDGETGYPIVDAGMRQLREEAFMHNRLRMVVASFLTKDLRIDWREGYDHFREHLADHDTANDTGGWQWAASTGTDAQPYFRVFNPVTQGERYDPDAAYVREYVPELADVSTERIHGWPDLTDDERREASESYPHPVVDHATAREAAIAMFERARGPDSGSAD